MISKIHFKIGPVGTDVIDALPSYYDGRDPKIFKATMSTSIELTPVDDGFTVSLSSPVHYLTAIEVAAILRAGLWKLGCDVSVTPRLHDGYIDLVVTRAGVQCHS